MKITYLGQAGLLFEYNGICVMLDPYLSDSVAAINPRNKRRVPVEELFFEKKPDVLIFTHDHLDHYDPETVAHFLKPGAGITVLSPTSVYQRVLARGDDNNYIWFNRGTSWSQGGLRFTAVKAEHSDPCAIGVLIDDGERIYYVTGDTLYNEEIFADLPQNVYALFLPVNGVGNNMNMTDAARFARRVGARFNVPVHVGLFDSLDPHAFECDNRVIPAIWRPIEFPDQ